MSTRLAGPQVIIRPVRSLGAVARPERHIRELCALALVVAAGLHLAVGFQHPDSNFGALALVVGASQLLLGAAVLLRSSHRLLQVVVMSGLVLIQLYLVNLTVGLPPLIAHSHIGGTHQLWGFTLAWPGVVDAQGIAATLTEALSVGCAAWLRRPAASGTILPKVKSS